MAQTAVDILVKTSGGNKLDQLASKLKRTEAALEGLQSSIKKQGAANAELAKKLRTLKSGYADIEAKAKGSKFSETTINKLRKLKQEIDDTRNKLRQGLEAKVKSTRDLDRLQRELKETQAEFKKTEAQAKKSSGGIAGTLRTIAGAYAAIQLTKFVVNSLAQFERIEKQLTTVTGSAETARRVFNQLDQVNKKSPFELTELTQAAAKLSAFGVENDKLVETTERLGKIAAGTSQEIGGIALAYGQVLAKGRLQGEELLQFVERGVPLQEELQRMLGLTGQEFADAMRKGQIGAELVEKAIENLTDEQGKFGKAFENTSGTVDNKLSNMRDQFAKTAAALGKAFEPQFKFLIDSITKVAQYFEGVFKRISRGQKGLAAEQAANQKATQFTRDRFGAVRSAAAAFTGDQEVLDFREKAKNSALQNELARVDRELAELRGEIGKPTLPKAPEAITQSEIAKNRSLLLGNGKGTGTNTTKPPTSKNDLAAIAQLAYGPQIIAAAKQNNIDPRLLAGLVQVESAFNPNAVSSAGAAGLTQLMPGTAGDLGVTDRFNPMQNLMGGAKYLRQMLDMFGNVPAALRAYNQGPGNQQRFPGGVSQEAVDYPGKVMSAARGFGLDGQSLADLGADTFATYLDQAARNAQRLADQMLRVDALVAGVKSGTADLESQLDVELFRGQLLAQGESEESIRRQVEQMTQMNSLESDRLAKIEKLKALNADGLISNDKMLEAEGEINQEYEKRVGLVNQIYAARDGNAAVTKQLEESRQKTEALKSEFSSLASGIAGEFTSAFKSIIDGTKSVNEAFADMLQGIADQFLNMAMKILQDALTQQLMQLFTSLAGAGAGGFGGAPQLSGIPFSAGGLGYEGGGYTGDAPRSGGLDGKGGFLSVLHPQETVVDHYGDAADAMTGASKAFADSSEAMTMAMATRSANTAAAAEASAMQTAETYFASNKSTVSFDTYRVGEMDVVTREDAMKIGMEAAKTSRGERLQRSP